VRAGRYALQGIIGKGGAATVHLAKLAGDGDFERIVAVKRLRPDVAHDESAVASFVEEATLASRIRSAHVVPTIDVVVEDREVLVVMDYVAGETLARLIVAAARADEDVPLPVVVAIIADTLRGLSAAHEATAADGTPLRLVHRDVSPQNVLVGTDGIARLLDFGIAKAIGRAQRTRTGMVKGKLGYMAPEQLQGEPIDARTDVYAAGVVLWEALTSERLFAGDDDDVIDRVSKGDVPAPSTRRAGVPPAIDAVVLRAVRPHAADRFATAADMLAALEAASARATVTEVSEFVQRIATESLGERARVVEECERAFVETTTLVAPSRTRKRRPVFLALAFAVVGILSIAVLAFAVRRRSSPETVAGMTPSTVEPAESSALADEEPSPSGTPPSSSMASPRRSRPANKIPRTPTTSSTNKCNPPFVIDNEGHKQWKRECF
jgi:eukaryotic-like serine/threonine-protein kinase